jgi:SNF2 family DNA or RNA helicase
MYIKFINEWLQNIPRSEASSLFVKKTVESLSDMVQSKETEECPICLENIEMKNVAITPCGHMFCRLCLKNILQKNGPADKSSTKDFNTKKRDFVDGECPMCNKWIHSSKITLMSQSSGLSEIGKDNEEQMQEKPNAECNSLTPLRDTLDAALRGNSSSKMTAILLELEKIWDVDPGSKIIVFSQFLGFLDLLEKPLRKKGIVYFRLDGSMSLKERCDELNQFNNSDGVKIPTNKDQGTCHQGSVLLASMKACGVGINLVAASSVFLVDPWWNAAFEDQCINRIHRIGQKAKIVRVRKFIVPNSVESKILQIQAKKKSIESEILSSGMKSQRGFNANPTLDDFISIFRAE